LKLRTFRNSSFENSESKTSDIDRTGRFLVSTISGFNNARLATFFSIADPDGLGPSMIFDESIV
jgi:hypothetical protein